MQESPIKVGVITNQSGPLSFLGIANANVARMVVGDIDAAGTLSQTDVIEALDHAKIPEGPGGPAEVVPGQHHVRMNMYIAQVVDTRFKIIKSLGVIDPKECSQGITKASRRLESEGELV